MSTRKPSSQRPNIVVLGGANTDFLVRASHLPQPGETVTGTEFDHAEAGGKGANQAVAAARLGARVTFIGRVGADDRGRALLRRLKAEGVNVQQVIRDYRAPTGVALINVDAHGEKQIIVAPGANQRLTPADIRRPATDRAIQQADILILQFEVPIAANLAAARIANKSGIPIVLDPAPASEGCAPARPTPESKRKAGKPDDMPFVPTAPRTSRKASNAISHLQSLLRLVTVLRANEHEAESLTGIKVKNRQTAQKAAKHLLEKYPRLRAAIISVGQGNLAVWRESGSPSAISHPPSAIDLRTREAPLRPSETLNCPHGTTDRGGGVRDKRRQAYGRASQSLESQRSTLNCLYFPRLKVKALDATGAGDAFIAALAVMLPEGHSIPTAAHFANAAAALATTKLGAQEGLPKRAAVLAWLKRFAR